MKQLHADWLMTPATGRVVEALSGQLYFVGGCVRNTLLGDPVSDLDIATPLEPGAVIKCAEDADLKVIPTGLDHGTVTIVAEDVSFEVTTFRRDVETDGRRAVVAFSTSLKEDASRRDFTINALYADPSGRIIDPLGGFEDLKARRVRFIFDPEQRIKEDALRILRFFRFTAWYGSDLDADGLSASAMLADRIDGLARERVGSELRKLLNAPDPAPSVAAMAVSGVLQRSLPGANAHALAPLVSLEEAAGAAPDWMTRLVALGVDDPVAALRLSRAEARTLATITALVDARLSPALAAAERGKEAAFAAQLVMNAGLPVDWTAIARELDRGATAEFPIVATDLLALGYSEGPSLGSALKTARETWLESNLSLDKEALLRQLRH